MSPHPSMKSMKIYHEKNGEILTVDEDSFYIFQKYRNKMEEISYKTEESPYGYFRVTLLFSEPEKKVYREWLWIPRKGYSWSEYKVEMEQL
jgi:hypothetical protein